MDPNLRHAGGWYIETAADVDRFADCGFDFFTVAAAMGDAAFDAVVTRIQQRGLYAIAILSGIRDPAESLRQAQRIKGRGLYGWIPSDEPNCGGTLMELATQRDWAGQLRAMDSAMQVVASYHLEPGGPSYPDHVEAAFGAGKACNLAMLNRYPARWGVSDADAAADLTSALAAAKAFFDSGAALITVEQCAGSTVDRRPQDWARPIPGLLAAQHAIWAASGLDAATGAACWYGAGGTCPQEDWNAADVPAVFDELAAVAADR